MRTDRVRVKLTEEEYNEIKDMPKFEQYQHLKETNENVWYYMRSYGISDYIGLNKPTENQPATATLEIYDSCD